VGRTATAYLIMAILALAVAGFIAFKLYHGRARAYRRQQRREDRIYGARMAEKDAEPD